jgi:hypothetical protein
MIQVTRYVKYNDLRRDSMINFMLRWHKLSFLIGDFEFEVLPRNKYVILIPRLSGANTSLTCVLKNTSSSVLSDIKIRGEAEYL